MLKIRRAQLHALVEARATTFNRQVAELLVRRSPEQASHLPPDYLDSLVELSMSTCREAGLSREGTIIEFAELMLKDAEHPMRQEQMSQKSQAILRDLRSRSLYEKLQAVNAASRRATGKFATVSSVSTSSATSSSATAARADASQE